MSVSTDLASCDFFLFPKIKKMVAGDLLTLESFKKAWDGVAATMVEDDFSMAFKSGWSAIESVFEFVVPLLKKFISNLTDANVLI